MMNDNFRDKKVMNDLKIISNSNQGHITPCAHVQEVEYSLLKVTKKLKRSTTYNNPIRTGETFANYLK